MSKVDFAANFNFLCVDLPLFLFMISLKEKHEGSSTGTMIAGVDARSSEFPPYKALGRP